MGFSIRCLYNEEMILSPFSCGHLLVIFSNNCTALCKDGVEKPKCKIGTKSSFNEVPIEVITDMLRMLFQMFFSSNTMMYATKKIIKLYGKRKSCYKID